MAAVWRPLVCLIFDKHRLKPAPLHSDNPLALLGSMPDLMKPVSRSSVVNILLGAHVMPVKASERSDSFSTIRLKGGPKMRRVLARTYSD